MPSRFGPPGSGKSFVVKEILNAVGGNGFYFEEMNLTQIQGDHELAQGLTHALTKAEMETKIPFIFFDEFDATRNGSVLKWLSWFLAPMNDSTYIFEGKIQKIDKAIFFFAGGTTSSFEQFSDNSSESFKSAKGPDFLSRLRGYLDVCGPNDPKMRMIRRAIIIRSALEKRAVVRDRDKSEGLAIDDNLLKALLQVGRYRHGARSIEAIIESSKTRVRSGRLTELEVENLPAKHIIDIHVDRGDFDPKRIGGSIQFSAGTVIEEQNCYGKVIVALANELWENGACIAYGGIINESYNLTRMLKEEVEHLPQPLCNERNVNDESDINDASVSIFLRLFPPVEWEATTEYPANFHKNLRIENVNGINEYDRLKLNGLMGTKPELRENSKVLDRLKNSICYFRMRWQVTEESIVLIAIGGKTRPGNDEEPCFTGRFSGVAEEIMCALAQKKPVYLCGGFGGMVQELGGLLGIAHYNGVPQSLDWSNENWKLFKDVIKGFDEYFRPPAYDELPLDDKDLVNYIKEHSLNGPKWINNGLTLKENRLLFKTDDIKEVCKLIKKGLDNLFCTS